MMVERRMVARGFSKAALMMDLGAEAVAEALLAGHGVEIVNADKFVMITACDREREAKAVQRHMIAKGIYVEA